MPWPAGMPKPKGPPAVRPTEIGLEIYGRLKDHSAKTGQSLRVLLERAILEFLERDGDD